MVNIIVTKEKAVKEAENKLPYNFKGIVEDVIGNVALYKNEVDDEYTGELEVYWHGVPVPPKAAMQIAETIKVKGQAWLEIKITRYDFLGRPLALEWVVK